jgi:hypothetical protein
MVPGSRLDGHEGGVAVVVVQEKARAKAEAEDKDKDKDKAANSQRHSAAAWRGNTESKGLRGSEPSHSKPQALPRPC